MSRAAVCMQSIAAVAASPLLQAALPFTVQGRHDAAEDQPTAFRTSVTSYHTR